MNSTTSALLSALRRTCREVELTTSPRGARDPHELFILSPLAIPEIARVDASEHSVTVVWRSYLIQSRDLPERWGVVQLDVIGGAPSFIVLKNSSCRTNEETQARDDARLASNDGGPFVFRADRRRLDWLSRKSGAQPAQR